MTTTGVSAAVTAAGGGVSAMCKPMVTATLVVAGTTVSQKTAAGTTCVKTRMLVPVSANRGHGAVAAMGRLWLCG